MSDSHAVLRARIDLPSTTGSVPIARHLVVQLLGAWPAKARHEESPCEPACSRGRAGLSQRLARPAGGRAGQAAGVGLTRR